MNLCLSVKSQLTLHVLECWQSTDITCARVLAVNRHYMCSSVGSQLTVHVLECWQSTDITCARVLAVNRQYMCSSVGSHLTLHVLECWQSTDRTCTGVLTVNRQWSVDSPLFFLSFLLPTQNPLMDVFNHYWERGEVTMGSFRSHLDKFSLFSGRNILVC